MNRNLFLGVLCGLVLTGSIASVSLTKSTDDAKPRKVVKTEAEWKKILTPEQFYVLRQQGTERPFTSPLVDNHEKGIFKCAACKTPLFSSTTKFESGTGWPSFYQPISKQNVVEKTDHTHGMVRTEVECGVCGGHLGHVFEDGPKPTGLRYCMNGVALEFEKK
ncbi:peptide-methionine (R)-S-oxide reductase MsrB [Larkinella terrae]|uniref:Peptide methionine sulfoxide reductase MsrB n=1 Tax=Larkinella terrae TaxID=2025311 RepID=A0A7K0ETP1_9BACT|nr:peptide-methionine (R)-S-oxide reductase MsrB [Larkinella terrae]MRS65183.1 peptide-methionine (R)-S-oxide reductase MsrB [Larkinella terrae]